MTPDRTRLDGDAARAGRVARALTIRQAALVAHRPPGGVSPRCAVGATTFPHPPTTEGIAP